MIAVLRAAEPKLNAWAGKKEGVGGKEFLPAEARGEAPSEANSAVNKLWWR